MKRAIQYTVALAISLFFIWFSLRGQDLHAIGRAIAQAHIGWVAAYVAMLFIIHLVRVIRWGVLLEPVVKVSLRDLNMLGAVGFMLLMLLPFRLGEFGRPLLVARHLKVSRSAALASVVFERIVDGIVMGLVLVILLWTLPISGKHVGDVRSAGALMTCLFVGLLVVLGFAYYLPGPTQATVRHTVGRIVPRIAERIIGMMQAFTDGLRVLPSVGKAIEFFALTTVYWGLAGYGILVLGWAFDLHFVSEQAFTLLGLQVIASMIPGPPGGVGAFQNATQIGIALFLGEAEPFKSEAAAYANVAWMCQFAQQVLYGLVFVLIGHIDLHGLVGMGGSDDDKPGDGSDRPNDAEKRAVPEATLP